MTACRDWKGSHVRWRGERARLAALDALAHVLDPLGCEWFTAEGLAAGETELVVRAPTIPPPGTTWHHPCLFESPLFTLASPPDLVTDLLVAGTGRAVRLVRQHQGVDSIPPSAVMAELAASYRALVPGRGARIRALSAHAAWLDRTMRRQGRAERGEHVCGKEISVAVPVAPLDRELIELGRRLSDAVRGRVDYEAVRHEVVARLMHLQVTRLWGADGEDVVPREHAYVTALRLGEEAELPTAHDG